MKITTSENEYNAGAWTLRPGVGVEVPDDRAKYLIATSAGKVFEFVEDTIAQPAPETTTDRRRRGRKRSEDEKPEA